MHREWWQVHLGPFHRQLEIPIAPFIQTFALDDDPGRQGQKFFSFPLLILQIITLASTRHIEINVYMGSHYAIRQLPVCQRKMSLKSINVGSFAELRVKIAHFDRSA
jgi:hypothetical protein